MPTATPIAANSGYTCVAATPHERERERERERHEATEEAHLGSDPAAGHRSRGLFGLRGDRDVGEGWGKWRGDGGGGGVGVVGGAVLSACGRLELPVGNDAPTLQLSFLFPSGCPLFVSVHRNYHLF